MPDSLYDARLQGFTVVVFIVVEPRRLLSDWSIFSLVPRFLLMRAPLKWYKQRWRSKGRFSVVFARSLVLEFQVNVAVSGVIPFLESA